MAMDEEELNDTIGAITADPRWQDETKRADFIRDVAVKSRNQVTPEQHRVVIDELWKRQDDKGVFREAAEFTAGATKEVALSLPAGGGAYALLATDAAGLTDSGSFDRVKRGVVDLVDAAGQRLKSLHPDDRQEKRDFALSELKRELDEGTYPKGFETWLAGGYDTPTGTKEPEDEETKAWIQGATDGLARVAVMADHMGEATPENLNRYVNSDRYLGHKGYGDLGMGPSARDLLADYVATRDPGSWEAFKARVSETDSMRQTRLTRQFKDRELRAVTQGGDAMDGLIQRSADMQTSPIDMVSFWLPFMSSAKAVQAARAGTKVAAVREALKGVASEAAQEGITEALSNPNASNAQIGKAALTGAVGAGVINTGAVTAGSLVNLVRPAGPDASGQAALPAPGGGPSPLNPASTEGAVALPAGQAAENLAQVAARGGLVDMATAGMQPAPGAAGSGVASPAVLGPAAPESVAAVAGSETAGVVTPEATATVENAGTGPVPLPAEAAATAPVGAADPVEDGLGQVSPRAKMGARILMNRGVDPEVATYMAAVIDLETADDLGSEQFADSVEQSFVQRGGMLPGTNTSGATLNADPQYWRATGMSEAAAAEAAANSRAWIEEDQRAAREANRAVLEKWADRQIAASRGRVNANIDPALFAAYVVKGAAIMRDLVKDFGKWSGVMIQRFGRGVKPYLKGVFAAAMKTSQMGFVLNPAGARRAVRSGTTEPVGAPSSVYYQGQGPFRVRWPGVRAVLKGQLLPKQLAQQVTRSAEEARAAEAAATRISRDLDAAIRGYARRTGQQDLDVYNMVNTAMEQPVMLAAMVDPGLREATRRARNYLDDLSQLIAVQTGGQTGRTIMQNLGQWMRRSYAAFDPEAGWNYDALERAASRNQPIAGQNAAVILNNARSYLRRQNPNITPGELEAAMRQLTDREVWGNVLTGVSGGISKDVTSLMHRQELAPEIRALMGEESNPIKRILNSASFQAQFIARHEMQQRMRDIGLRLGIFSTDQTGVYTAQVGGDAGAGNRRWSGFGTLYTTPQMLAALQNAKGVTTGTDMGGKFLEFVKFVGGEAKLNKVALNPDAAAVNMLGVLTGLVQSGDLYSLRGVQNMWRAVELLRSGRTQRASVMNTARGLLQDARRQMLSRLEAAGVTGSLNMQDLEANLDNRVLQFIQGSELGDRVSGAARGANLGRALGGIFGETGKVVGAATGAAAGAAVGGSRIVNAHKFVAEWLLSKPDNWGKVSVFLTNYEAHLAAGMPEAQAFQLAADKTRNTMPDYSKLPVFVRELSRLGVTGSFVAFQWEVYRNFIHGVRYAVQELQTGNPTMMARGASRLFGLATTFGLGGWSKIAGLALMKGATDEEDEAYRRALARPWDRFSNLAYDKLDKNGASYTNSSYLIPQATMWELFGAAMEGGSVEEKLENVAKQLGDQFVNGSVHADPMLEAVMNVRKFGGKVSTEQGARQYWDRMEHVLKNTFTPAYADKADRYARAITERGRGDRVYSVEEENLRLLGVRKATFTHEERMLSKLYEFRDRLEDARAVARKAWTENGKSKPDAVGRAEQEAALARANEAIARVTSDMEQWKQDLGTLGIKWGRVMKVQSDRSVYVRPKELRMTREGPKSAG
jgi:DNA-binding protein Fis